MFQVEERRDFLLAISTAQVSASRAISLCNFRLGQILNPPARPFSELALQCLSLTVDSEMTSVFVFCFLVMLPSWTFGPPGFAHWEGCTAFIFLHNV